MKNKTTTLHDERELNNAKADSQEAKGLEWKLGLDVDLRYIVVAMQCGRARLDRRGSFCVPNLSRG
jgi:hypothetical protein